MRGASAAYSRDRKTPRDAMELGSAALARIGDLDRVGNPTLAPTPLNQIGEGDIAQEIEYLVA